MFRYIEKLQKKPEYVKIGIALFFTTLLFFIIMLVWFRVAGNPFVEKKESRINETLSPFTVLGDTFVGIYDNAENNLSRLKEQFSGGN